MDPLWLAGIAFVVWLILVVPPKVDRRAEIRRRTRARERREHHRW